MSTGSYKVVVTLVDNTREIYYCEGCEMDAEWLRMNNTATSHRNNTMVFPFRNIVAVYVEDVE